MTVNTASPGSTDEPTDIDTTPVPEASARSMKKLQTSLLVMNMALYAVAGGVSSILLPLQIQHVDADGKSSSLGVILSIGALSAMVAQPIIGWLSDRARTRLGRRSPFILAGGFLAAGVLVGLGLGGTTAFLIGLGWALTQVTINVLKSPLQAIVADRVPRTHRGTTSTFIGVGTMAGSLGGTTIAAQLSGNLMFAFAGLGVFFAICAVLFVIANPEASNRDEPRAVSVSSQDRRAAFPLNPRRYPDFSFVFLGRFLLVLGYVWFSSYKLYVLQDFVGLTKEAAVALMPVIQIVSLAATLVAILIVGPLSDRLSRRRIFLVLSAIMLVFALLLPLLLPSVPGVLIATIFDGLGFGIYTALSIAVMTEVLPDQKAAAKDLGIMNMASTLAQTVSPLLAAAVIGGLANRYGTMLVVGAVSILLSAVAFSRVKGIR